MKKVYIITKGEESFEVYKYENDAYAGIVLNIIKRYGDEDCAKPENWEEWVEYTKDFLEYPSSSGFSLLIRPIKSFLYEHYYEGSLEAYEQEVLVIGEEE